MALRSIYTYLIKNVGYNRNLNGICTDIYFDTESFMLNLVSKRLPSLFLPSFFPLKMPLSYTGAWGAPPQVQDFTVPFVELHEIPVDPFLQLVEVILDGSTIL